HQGSHKQIERYRRVLQDSINRRQWLPKGRVQCRSSGSCTPLGMYVGLLRLATWIREKASLRSRSWRSRRAFEVATAASARSITSCVRSMFAPFVPCMFSFRIEGVNCPPRPTLKTFERIGRLSGFGAWLQTFAGTINLTADRKSHQIHEEHSGPVARGSALRR